LGLKQMTDYIIKAVEKINNIDEYQEFLKIAASLNESLENVLLIKEQKPETTRILTKEDWLKMGIEIKPEEEAIQIFSNKVSSKIFGKVIGNEQLIYTDLIEVYDISQTNGSVQENIINIKLEDIEKDFENFKSKNNIEEKIRFLRKKNNEIKDITFNAEKICNQKAYDIYQNKEISNKEISKEFEQGANQKKMYNLENNSFILHQKLKSLIDNEIFSLKISLHNMINKLDNPEFSFSNLREMDKLIYSLNQKNLEIEHRLDYIKDRIADYQKAYNSILNLMGKDMIKADKIVDKMSLNSIELFKSIETKKDLITVYKDLKNNYMRLGKTLDENSNDRLKNEFSNTENMLQDLEKVIKAINEKELSNTINMDKSIELEF